MGEPVFLSLLTADKVIEEKITNKRSIIGTFTNFHAGQFPATFPPWFIYASATNLVGKHNSSINITMDSSNLVVFSAGGTPQIENVNSVV